MCIYMEIQGVYIRKYRSCISFFFLNTGCIYKEIQVLYFHIYTDTYIYMREREREVGRRGGGVRVCVWVG